jgi:hypothetical protein
MAEVERLKIADSAHQSSIFLKNRVNQIVNSELAPVIAAVDKWEIDDFILLENGMWTSKDEE